MSRFCKCGEALPEGRKNAYCRACNRAYMKAWRSLHPERTRELTTETRMRHLDRYREVGKEWRRNNPHKRSAQDKAQHAVKTGKLTKLACQECGHERSEAHHPDYSKPLEVIWLCRSCHRKLHLREKAS